MTRDLSKKNLFNFKNHVIFSLLFYLKLKLKLKLFKTFYLKLVKLKFSIFSISWWICSENTNNVSQPPDILLKMLGILLSIKWFFKSILKTKKKSKNFTYLIYGAWKIFITVLPPFFLWNVVLYLWR